MILILVHCNKFNHQSIYWCLDSAGKCTIKYIGVFVSVWLCMSLFVCLCVCVCVCVLYVRLLHNVLLHFLVNRRLQEMLFTRRYTFGWLTILAAHLRRRFRVRILLCRVLTVNVYVLEANLAKLYSQQHRIYSNHSNHRCSKLFHLGLLFITKPKFLIERSLYYIWVVNSYYFSCICFHRNVNTVLCMLPWCEIKIFILVSTLVLSMVSVFSQESRSVLVTV